MAEKIKVYLDTNICKEQSSLRRRRTFSSSSVIHDYFVNQARSIRQKQELKVPEKFKFILASREKAGFVTSFLTKAEVMRELIAAHGVNYEEIQPVWNDFIENIYCSYVNGFRFDEKLVEIVSKLPMKLRTMINFMHLFIAMELKSYIVSGDKDMINKIKLSGLYNYAITYQELRQIVEEGEN